MADEKRWITTDFNSFYLSIGTTVKGCTKTVANGSITHKLTFVAAYNKLLDVTTVFVCDGSASEVDPYEDNPRGCMFRFNGDVLIDNETEEKTFNKELLEKLSKYIVEKGLWRKPKNRG